MTSAPSRPCRSPGCSALVPSGQGTWCPAHRRQSTVHRAAHDAARGTAAARGYGADWQRERLAWLAKYPLCMGVLMPTAEWTIELAIAFHRLREIDREQGKLLLFTGGRGDNAGELNPSASSATSCEKWLEQNPIYRREPWDHARPATVVDHIIPHKGDHLLMWAEWNWQPLTKRAHDRKTATEKAAPWTERGERGDGASAGAAGASPAHSYAW